MTGRTGELDALLAAAVEESVVPGVHAMTADPGGVTFSGGAGARGETGEWSADTVAWLASLTKTVVAVAVLQMVDDGRFDLDAPVGEHELPELAAPLVLEGYDGERPRLRPATRAVTLRRLLSHTAGAPFADPGVLGLVERFERRARALR